MGIGKLFSARKRTENDYIDLGEHTNGTAPEAAASWVRVAEVTRMEDVKALNDWVYKGNMLILDFAPIADNEVLLRRVTTDLKRVVTDVGGDIAGFGKNMLIVTPTGVKVERTKLRATATN